MNGGRVEWGEVRAKERSVDPQRYSLITFVGIQRLETFTRTDIGNARTSEKLLKVVPPNEVRPLSPMEGIESNASPLPGSSLLGKFISIERFCDRTYSNSRNDQSIGSLLKNLSVESVGSGRTERIANAHLDAPERAATTVVG